MANRIQQRYKLTEDGYYEVFINSKGKEYVVLLDSEDIYLVQERSICRSNTGHIRRTDNTSLHRTILEAKPNELVDHINGNPLDNRRSNLRIVNYQQNNWARHKVSAKSGYKGVHKRSNQGWEARIKFNGKLIRLGTHKTVHKAARAYNQAAIALFGEYAVLNEIEK